MNQGRLAGAWSTGDEAQGELREPAAEDLVEAWNAGLQSPHLDMLGCCFNHRRDLRR
jgi:hypothetical protein